MPKYIDADDLIFDLKRANRHMTSDSWSARGVYALIEKQPAADVEEVEHGDWVEYTNRDGQMASYCSACGSDPGVLYLYRRCPECGAHMSRKLTKEKDSE